MGCFSKRTKRVEKRYRKNSIHPMAEKKVDASFMESFLRETMHCGNCRDLFPLNSDELKIHCNICNEFFHCGIAGKCKGDSCRIIKPDGTEHRASYCNGCVSKIYKDGMCLCNDCV